MTTTSRIRYLEPVDPRAVFELAGGLAGDLIGRPSHHRADHRLFPNPYIRADFTDALVVVEYGHEGAKLAGDEPTDPAGHAEVRISTTGATPDAAHLAWITALMWSLATPCVWLLDSCCTAWHRERPYSTPWHGHNGRAALDIAD